MSYKPDAPEIYQGKQVIINSDRLLFNAKDDAILLFSNKAIGFSTNGSIHFDTSDKKDGDNASKVVINSPNIYLGLKREYGEDILPTEPAVLGDYLGDIWLLDLLECLEGLINDLITKVAFITTAPGAPTGPNPSNNAMLSLRKQQIKDLKDNIQYFKSKITKIA
jgi:hypothetical protein|tara:strand:- start:7951 stop:8445 length:495 start_codon:yes stop_codon:yes gene_type:complete